MVWKYSNGYRLIDGKVTCRVEKPVTVELQGRIKTGSITVHTGNLYDCHRWLKERGEKILP